MNINILKDNKEFKEFLDRVREIRTDYISIVLTTDEEKLLFRAQGSIEALDRIINLPEEIQSEEFMEDEVYLNQEGS